MLDLAKIRERANQFVTEAAKTVRQIAPAAMSAEKRFVNAVAGGLALMTFADRRADQEEATQAINFLSEIDTVRELGMQAEAVALYQKYVEILEPATQREHTYVIERGKILGEISLIRGQTERVQQLLTVIRHFGKNTPPEIEVRDEIAKAVS